MLTVFCRIYLLLLMVAVGLLSSFPFPWLSLALLLIYVYAWLSNLNYYSVLAIDLTAFCLMPLSLGSEIGSVPGAMLSVPLLALLDGDLREAARLEIPGAYASGYRVTPLFISLLIVSLLVIVAALLAASLTLMVTGVLLWAYLSARLGYSVFRLRGKTLTCSSAHIRVLAGEEVKVGVVLNGLTAFKMTVCLREEHPWMKVEPRQFELADSSVNLTVTLTAPLSGPSTLNLYAVLVDQWGMIWQGQKFAVAELHVVPRAKYATWLARKYLERSTVPSYPVETVARSRHFLLRGTDYQGPREYQPGDRLRDIDWKHTLKLGKPIVKEFLETGAEAVIVLVNLVAGDAEEADWLAYSLVSSTLTLAQWGVPISMVAYRQEEVAYVRAFSSPRDGLRLALRLVPEITTRKAQLRILDPPDVLWLKRNLNLLEREVQTEMPSGLSEILHLEIGNLEGAVADHPATKGLQKLLGKAKAPGFVTIISLWNHDVEALSVLTSRLKARGYAVLDLRRGHSTGIRPIRSLSPVGL